MTVTARGVASVPARPDRAVVLVDVRRLAHTPHEALDDVVVRVERVLAVLDALGVSAADRSTSGVSVGEQREWRDGTEVSVGYLAVERLEVRLTEPARIGRVLREVVAEGASVHGPSWEVDAANPARVEAYRLAALDARRRAEAYAAALGHRLGAPLQVREPGTAVAPPDGAQPMLLAASADLHRADLHRAGVPVEPGAVDVLAAVDVTFALVAG